MGSFCYLCYKEWDASIAATKKLYWQNKSLSSISLQEASDTAAV
jgi:hypothetical protein